MFRTMQGFLNRARNSQRRSPNRSKASRFAAKPVAELLDKRALLSVVVNYDGTNLTVTGDDAPNFIALYDFSTINAPNFFGYDFLITDGGSMTPIQKSTLRNITI